VDDSKKHLMELVDIIRDSVAIPSPFAAFQNKKLQE
jgi:hypothetical protein